MAILDIVPQDKQGHVLAGFTIAAWACVFASPSLALLAAIAAGAGKELVDWFINRRLAAAGEPPAHDVDFNDFLATAAGGFAAVVTITIVKRLIA